MSDTDAHRPVWVQLNDHHGDVVARHGYQCQRSGGGECDLPSWPVDKHHLNTACGYRPTGELWEQIYRGSGAAPHSRQPFRREWFASERAAQRVILRSLTRDATFGGEVDEDVIDNRQTHRYETYGGGWRD